MTSPQSTAATVNRLSAGPDLPKGSAPGDPSGAYRRGGQRPRQRVNPRTGQEEHRHPGADYWHPVRTQHGRRGASDEEARAETERMHEAAGLGKDGMGGDTVSRAGIAQSEINENGEGKVWRAMGTAALAAGVIGKNIGMNLGSLTDKAFSGIRRAVDACLSPNPLSAPGAVMVDSLAKVGDTSREMAEIQRRYGIGSKGPSLETTLAGRRMTREQRAVREGTSRAMASISRMMTDTGADRVDTMDVRQLQGFADANSRRLQELVRQAVDDSMKPSSKRMSRNERRALLAELKAHRDMNDQITGRAKDIRSDAKEMAARIGHQRQYLNQMASIRRQEDRARLQQEAQARFEALPEWGREIYSQVGARVHLDADGVPTNPSKRTAARRVLDTELDRARRQLDAMSTARMPDPERERALRDRVASMEEGLGRIDSVDAREREAKEEERRRARAQAEEERRREREQGVIDTRTRLSRMADFSDPQSDPAAAILRRAGVYDSERGLDGHLVPQGTHNNPRLREALAENNRRWEAWAAENGVDISKDPRYVSSMNTEAAAEARGHMDFVTRQLDRIATMSDDDIQRYFPGASRDRLEEDLRTVRDTYYRDRTEFPVDEIASRGRELSMIPRDRAMAFQDTLNTLEEKWGLNRYARQPKGEAQEPEQEAPGQEAPGGGGGGGGGRAVKRLPERIGAEPLDPSPDPQETPRPETRAPSPEPVRAVGDTPIYDEGAYESYEVPTAEGVQTVARRRRYNEGIPSDPGMTVEGDTEIPGGYVPPGPAPQVPGPVPTAEEGYGTSEGETSLEEPGEAPAEPVAEQAQDVEGVPDEQEPPPEEGRWSSAPTTADLTHAGRGNSASNLAFGSVGTTPFDSRNVKYLIEPEDMRDALVADPERAADVMGAFRYRGMTGTPAMRAALDDNLYDMRRRLEERGADLSGLSDMEVIAAYYEAFPKDRAAAIRTYNAMEFEAVYNGRIRDPEQRLPPYEYTPPTFVDRTARQAAGESDEAGEVYERDDYDIDDADTRSPVKQGLMDLLDDYPMLGVDPEGMTSEELGAAIRQAADSAPKERRDHLLRQLDAVFGGKGYKVWRDPAKAREEREAERERQEGREDLKSPWLLGKEELDDAKRGRKGSKRRDRGEARGLKAERAANASRIGSEGADAFLDDTIGKLESGPQNEAVGRLLTSLRHARESTEFADKADAIRSINAPLADGLQSIYNSISEGDVTEEAEMRRLLEGLGL